MNNQNLTNCPQCPNHCPKENLMCGRGKMFFGQEDSNGQEGHKHNHVEKPLNQMSDGEQVLHYLRKCGHALHHNPNFAQNNNLIALSSDEQALLKQLLAKLYNSWDNG